MSEAAEVDRLAVRLAAFMGTMALAVGLVGALEVSPEHRLISGTGTLAIALLLSSFACSPAATLVGRASLALALRRARRWLGVSAALAALAHAVLGAYGYLGSIDVDAIVSVAWLRDGALALLVLGALGLTSFPRLTRALHVRAWSALHRLVYAAAVLACLHAIGAPYGDVGGGIFALSAVALLIAARPLAHAIAARRRRASADER